MANNTHKCGQHKILLDIMTNYLTYFIEMSSQTKVQSNVVKLEDCEGIGRGMKTRNSRIVI